MKINDFKVAGILVNDEMQDTNTLHFILSSYGNVIRSRLGVADPVDDKKIKGLIILELVGEKYEMDNLIIELNNIKGVQVKEMKFEDFI